jgi:hypothetical protein
MHLLLYKAELHVASMANKMTTRTSARNIPGPQSAQNKMARIVYIYLATLTASFGTPDGTGRQSFSTYE